MKSHILPAILLTPILSLCSLDARAARLYPSDFVYLGAFRVPATVVYGLAGNDTYPAGLSYRPDGDPNGSADGFPGTLFFSRNFSVGEITIPKPIKPTLQTNPAELNQAQELQSTRDITGGKQCSSCDYVGEATYVPAKGSQKTAKLYWTSYEYYNVDSTDYDSIGWSEIDLNNLNAQGSWHVGPAFATGGQAYHGNKYGDYIFPVNQQWADTYLGGKSLFVGRFREGGTYNSSSGPVLTAIAPWNDNGGNPPASGAKLDALPLMYFANNPSSNWNKFNIEGHPKYKYFSAIDKWNGGAWVEAGDKKAIVIVGRHGTYDGIQYTDICKLVVGSNGCQQDPTGYGPHCYGYGEVDCPKPIATNNYKGMHSGPYYPTILFIDPDELALVAQGKKAHDDMDAYTFYDPSADFVFKDLKGDNHLGGVAYDSTNGLLYIMQVNIYRPDGPNTTPYPVIHVYKIGSTSSTLTAPSNLRIN